MLGVLRVLFKELLQLRQDRKMIPALLLGPVIQLLALGYAANTDVHHVPLLLVDEDRTPASRGLAERFTGSTYFELVGAVDSADAVEPWMVDGRAQIALVIPAGYGGAAEGGRRPRVQVIADGTDANSAVVGLAYAARILGAAGAELAASRASRPGANASAPGALGSAGRIAIAAVPATLAAVPAAVASAPRPRAGPPIDLLPRVWYNPDLKSRWFYVPAVLAMVLMLVTMMLPSMAVVREKEIGTLEQIIVSPLRSWQLILGKLLPFVAIGLLDLLLVTALATWHFGVPLRGSLALLIGLTLLFLFNTLGLGLLVSTLVDNQQQAMMFSAFVLMVPMIYLSGLIFPIENMPRAIQAVTRVVPVRYYANVIRGIFLKGSGIAILWPDAAAMAALGAMAFTVATLRFRKSLD